MRDDAISGDQQKGSIVMNIKIKKAFGPAVAGILASAALGLSLCSAAHASAIVLNFDGLQDGEYVNSYYAGGTGSLGSGPGANYGVTFTSDGFVGSQAPGGSLFGVTALSPSQPNVLIFDGSGTATMNVSGGFTSMLSFYYSSLYVPAIVTVWSGLNDTGTLLAMLKLQFTQSSGSPACNGAPFCPYGFASTVFSGTAMSVDLASAAAGNIAFDNITLGASTTPLPPTWLMLLAGLVGLGFGANRGPRTALSLRQQGTERPISPNIPFFTKRRRISRSEAEATPLQDATK